MRDCPNLESVIIFTQPRRVSKLFIGGPYLYIACDLFLHLSIDGSSIPIELFSYVSSYAPNLRILRIINCYLTDYRENIASRKEISSRERIPKKSNVVNLSFGHSVIKAQLKIGKQSALCLI